MRLAPVVLAAMMGLSLGCGGDGSPPADTAIEPVSLENGSFTAEVEGRTIHYEVRGSGPVVMALTNSWGLSLEGLREMYAPLAEKLTMVYFDPRGMGSSSPVVDDTDMGLAAVREDFHALRRHLGLERVNAIGWSNGAVNLILLAAENPETIGTAVFVHGIASFGPEDSVAFAQRYPELTRLYVAFLQEMADDGLTDDEKNARMRELWLGDYFPAIAADPETSGPLIQKTFAHAQLSWPHARYANEESPAFDFRQNLGSITARCLVIAGAEDSLPPDKVREISDGITDATFMLFEHSGHFAPLEEPDGFTTAVFLFLGVE